MKGKSIEDILCDFLEKYGIEGFIKLMEEDDYIIDPTFEWLCERCDSLLDKEEL